MIYVCTSYLFGHLRLGPCERGRSGTLHNSTRSTKICIAYFSLNETFIYRINIMFHGITHETSAWSEKSLLLAIWKEYQTRARLNCLHFPNLQATPFFYDSQCSQFMQRFLKLNLCFVSDLHQFFTILNQRLHIITNLGGYLVLVLLL